MSATAWASVSGFPTRYEAFERPGVWCFLDVDWSTVPAPVGGQIRDARWTEMAVYHNPTTKLDATIRRHPTAINGCEFVAEVYRNGHGESLLAYDFGEAVKLANEWLGLV